MSDEEQELTLYDHLAELRSRLVWISASVMVCAIGSFVFSDDLFYFLTHPLREQFVDGKFIGTGVAEAFIVKLKVSLFAGFVLAAPMVFYQLWLFISPGLLEQEKKIALPFVLACTMFFLVGVSFCFELILPFAFQFFNEQFSSIGVTPDIRIGEYLSFVTRLLLVFGAVFELPVLTYFLARLDLISAEWLVTKGRYSIVIIFVAAAILTPPDVTTQVLLALPLMVLYAMCIGIAYVVRKPKD